jgi:hypothetical protein
VNEKCSQLRRIQADSDSARGRNGLYSNRRNKFDLLPKLLTASGDSCTTHAHCAMHGSGYERMGWGPASQRSAPVADHGGMIGHEEPRQNAAI